MLKLYRDKTRNLYQHISEQNVYNSYFEYNRCSYWKEIIRQFSHVSIIKCEIVFDTIFESK